MEKKNKLIDWDTKEDRFKSTEFNVSVNEIEPKNIELLAEGYRCMCQIIINLLKDFEIFSTFPIRVITN